MLGVGLEDVATVRDGLFEPLSFDKLVDLSPIGA
jgi:hypothetical protein